MNIEYLSSVLPVIGSEAFVIYLCMMAECSPDGLCDLSISDLSKIIGSSKPTIIRAIGKLEAAGMIEKQHRFRASSVYTVLEYKNKKSLFFYPTTTTLINNTEVVDIECKNKLSLFPQDELPDGDLAPFADAYSSLTGTFMETPRNIKALSEIKEMGAKPEDIREAIEILRGKKFTFNGPAGLVNTIRTIVTERNLDKKGVVGRNSNGHKAPAPPPAPARPPEVIRAEIEQLKARQAAAKAAQEAK